LRLAVALGRFIATADSAQREAVRFAHGDSEQNALLKKWKYRHVLLRSGVLTTAMTIFFVGCPVTGRERKAEASQGSEKNPAADKYSFQLPALVPAPQENQATPARIALGKMLFFDPRLSGSGTISCANCHNPGLGWSDGLPYAQGDGMRPLARRTLSIVNVAFNKSLMWDGRITSLEEQVWSPMLAPAEMHGAQRQILLTLKSIPGYVAAFDAAYPGDGITPETVGKAVASFERTVLSRDSPFDRWTAGEEHAISEDAKRGFALFSGKANCSACHQGGNFTDDGFHNLGLKDSTDLGRFGIVPVRIAHGAFKTPTLRDVVLISPYMHNGTYRTLREVIEHYDRGGDDKSNIDPNMKPLGLTAEEKQDLVEFLKSLTGRQPALAFPELPPPF